ncbi:SDR family NAD(P)-dependent oxidoreductase [Phenylobacterium sp. LjRoot219]|uniref:SDR family NAD(P)-dependent oxidoreductase n=1 Tax=Phenylobacterium sp. LjRoot219 TaxID=3342283 RepID=UPI003ED022D9
MTHSLSGQVAMVTGASSGLGAHFARLLAGQGAAVALAARRVDRVQALADEISAAGGRALALELDVADAHAIGPALDQVEAGLGPLGIMVNNAGVGGAGSALEQSIEALDQIFSVNLRAVFIGAREAARRMIASGVAGRDQARIINIASVAAHTVLPGLAAYCASKAGVAMTTQALAREWAAQRIAVNALCPGYIETEINADWFATAGGAKQIKGFPRRRLMDISGLDEAFLLLAGPGAKAITGSLITVDDGQALAGGG